MIALQQLPELLRRVNELEKALAVAGVLPSAPSAPD
jgi:hypothetical protein